MEAFPVLNHFPVTDAALGREFGILTAEQSADVRERAVIRQRINERAHEIAVIERTLIAHLARTAPPNAILRAADGTLWQAVGHHLRQVAMAPTGVVIDAPAPEPVTMPPMADLGYCDCPTCQALADAPVELADDVPAYRVKSIQEWIAGGGLLRGGPDLRAIRDWIAGSMSGAAVKQTVDAAEREGGKSTQCQCEGCRFDRVFWRQQAQGAEVSGSGAAVNANHLERGEC